MVYAYTNLNFTEKQKEDPFKLYDLLVGSGVIRAVVSNMSPEDWSDIKGCYIKLLDPKKVIPVKLLNYTIGYYYMHDTELDITNHHCKHGHRFSNIIDNISDKIPEINKI